MVVLNHPETSVALQNTKLLVTHWRCLLGSLPPAWGLQQPGPSTLQLCCHPGSQRFLLTALLSKRVAVKECMEGCDEPGCPIPLGETRSRDRSLLQRRTGNAAKLRSQKEGHGQSQRGACLKGEPSDLRPLWAALFSPEFGNIGLFPSYLFYVIFYFGQLKLVFHLWQYYKMSFQSESKLKKWICFRKKGIK